jgi:tetratricopeptide (TPR) repeat protein
VTHRNFSCLFGGILMLTVLLAGCQREDESSAQELLRQKQLRESAKLSRSLTAEERLGKAEDLLEEGNAIAARRAVRPMLISDPEAPEVILLAARCEAALSNFIEAVTMLEDIEDWPDEQRATALWLAADWSIAANQFERAEQRLRRLLELNADSIRAHRKLAMLLNNLGRRVEAAEHLRALARRGEIREKELFAMNCYSEPFIDDSMPRPDAGNELLPVALMQAKIHRVEGRMEASLSLTERLVNAFPDSTAAYAFLGRLHADFQNDERLGRWIQAAPDGIEKEPQYWHSVGTWLQRKDQHRQAVRCFAETVTLDPTDRIAYSKLASSLRLVGEQEKSDAAVERAELLSETSRIAKKIGLEPGTEQELNRMADLLDQLQRPWEALGWRMIAMQIYGGTPEQRAALQQRRRELQTADESSSGAPSKTFLACGLDLKAWPLPEFRSMTDQQSPGPKSSDKRLAEGIPFQLPNVAAEVGLRFQYDNGDDPADQKQFLHQLTGGGIGVIDFDLDGSFDLYFSQGGGEAFDPDGGLPNRLFRNHAGRRFVDISQNSATDDRGYGQGVTVSDINQDGFPDLLIANIGPNRLFLNQGDGSFQEHALPVTKNDGGWTSSIAVGDLSGDHLPEVFQVDYIDDPTAFTVPCNDGDPNSCNPRRFRAAADQVWQVQPDMSIVPWAGCQDISEKVGYGFGAVMTNFDGNAGNELFVSNDGTENHYWVSQQTADSAPRHLVESARIYGCDSGLFGAVPGCMGIAYGDFDRNGRLDLHITNFWNQPADLYLQNTNGLFSNANVSFQLASESRQTVGWGTQAIDLDRDGWLDLAVLNGHLQDFGNSREPYRMQPQLFRGTPDSFRNELPAGDRNGYWSTPALGRTLAVLDWNSDARPDLVSNHLDVPVALLENQCDGGNSIQLELIGTVSERDAIGAWAKITCGNESWTRWVVGGDGLLCTNEPTLDFGIGDFAKVDRIEVHWPSGAKQQFEGLPANQRLLIVEGHDRVHPRR